MVFPFTVHHRIKFSVTRIEPILITIAAVLVLIAAASVGMAAIPAGLVENGSVGLMWPLSVHPLNSRYFSDGIGNAVYITDSHTWNNFQETDIDDTNPFDYWLISISCRSNIATPCASGCGNRRSGFQR